MISNVGVNAIASSLIDLDVRLKSLDLSWNSIGSKADRDRIAVKSIGLMFLKNKSLTHLDLSQNNFSSEDAKMMAAFLKDNHTIMGLHMQGNGSYVDEYGFLIPSDDSLPLADAHVAYRIFEADNQSTRSQIGGTVGDTLRSKAKSHNCWICEKWQERRFSYQTSMEDVGRLKDGLVAKRYYGEPLLGQLNIIIAFSFEQWKGDVMLVRPPKDFTGQNYKIPAHLIFGSKHNLDETDHTVSSLPEMETFRMCPLGVHYYAISVNGGRFAQRCIVV